ncbi:MAG: 50S ribosomal protein L17 [Candidatus Marinimicrobia bacterium]|nr:50S ribosomal protein L17 [Candidatus Neomarinimicrobiota bacterium]|tara:strand:- start:725 stop:1138 length:414 start_codon:yes stop_codon:yes gene_type:complete
MRHLLKGRKLNRTASHRLALKRNLAISLIEHRRIKTTLPKAKELQGFVERLITYAKKNNLSSHRLITKKLPGSLGKKSANILIHDIAPNYNDRNGGYTRIIKLDNRKNDNAQMSIIEFVDLKLEDTTEESAPEKDSK